MIIDASIIGLLLTYVIWGLRGLAVVAALAIAYAVLVGACLIDCSGHGLSYGALAVSAVIGFAVVYPRQFLAACGWVVYGIFRAALLII